MKTQPTNTYDLRNLITVLENKEVIRKREIQDCFASLLEDLKPVNLIKNIGRSVFSGSNKEELKNSVIGLGTGMFIRKQIVGNTNNFFGKSIGKLIQWGIAGIVAKNASKIKLKAIKLFLNIFSTRNNSKLAVTIQSEGIPRINKFQIKYPELIKPELT